MIDPNIRKILVRPFLPEECKKRRGPGGAELTYVDQHAVISRLNEAFGVGGWSWELRAEVCDGSVMVTGSLVVDGARHDGCSIEPLGGSRDPEVAIKIADTDALKRAARLFGVGLHLYDKNDSIHKEVTRRSSRRDARPPNSSRLTDKQLRAIYAIAKSKDINRDQLLSGIKRDYNKTPEYLSSAEASDVIKRLEVA